jgi:DNA-directed RNA polymerase specialized sigma24 family protein
MGFVHEHYPRLVRLAGLVTRDVDQAQDAVQAALERALAKTRPGPCRTASARGWTASWFAKRSARRRTATASAPWRHEATDWVDMPASTPEPTEMAVLREALGRLSPDHRAVVALHLYAGYSVEETARVLHPVRHRPIPPARRPRAAPP